MATDEITTFRTQLMQLLPWWLRGSVGGRIAYAIGIVIDVIADMAVDAVALRFPRTAQADALAMIGADRKIPRGPAELASIYITRLRRWLDDHRTRGGPYAMLAQLHAFWSAAPFPIRLFFSLGPAYDMATDGTVTRTSATPSALHWPIWWLYFTWPVALHSDGLWSSPGTWSDGGVWDSDLTPQQVADIRCVPTAWNAAHATGLVVLTGPDASVNLIAINEGV